MNKIIVSEANIEKAIDAYYNFEEEELYKITEQFAQKQPLLIANIASLEKEMPDNLFEELIDASVITWMAFGNQFKDLKEVMPEAFERIEKRNTRKTEELAKKLNIDADKVWDVLAEFNDKLGQADNPEEFKKLMSQKGGEEIFAFIMNYHSGKGQENMKEFATFDVAENLEEMGFSVDQIQDVVEMLLFQIDCYDLTMNPS